VEPTSFAERFEAKGYVLLDLRPGGDGGRLMRARFVKLPVRPMVTVRLEAGCSLSELRRRLAVLDPNAVVQVRPSVEQRGGSLTAATLRELAPPTMSISLLSARPSWGSPPKNRRPRSEHEHEQPRAEPREPAVSRKPNDQIGQTPSLSPAGLALCHNGLTQEEPWPSRASSRSRS